VELPAGESMLVELSLNWYTAESVTAGDCPEASPFSTCELAHAFAAGSYEVVVPYDDLAAMTSQELEETTDTQWGYTVWMAPGIGTVAMSNEQRQSFELSGNASAVTVTITN
jgi:2-phospho-L-lactate guanylyltransferase (CobY/MobA/RfbA family)